MEVDRNTLIKLLEAFVGASEDLQRELGFYQMLFATAWKEQGRSDESRHEAVDRARAVAEEKIRAHYEAGFRDLVAKLPQIVDMLAQDQDAALRFLKEHVSKWGPN
jgi:hypothetical protein